MRHLTVEYVFDLICKDGLYDAVSELSSKDIIDLRLAELLDSAHEILSSIDAYVEDHRFEEDEMIGDEDDSEETDE